MTCREKVQCERPEAIDTFAIGGVGGCPTDYSVPGLCHVDGKMCGHLISEETCTKCWDQQIPETENIEKESKNMRKTKAELEQELIDKQTEILNLNKELDNLNRYNKYEEIGNELHAMMEAMINSGFTRDEAFQMLHKMIPSM